MRYFKLYLYYTSMSIKAKLAYKVDAIVGIFSFLLINTLGIVTLSLIFNTINVLDGWTLEELLFLYGICLLPKALDHLFTDAIWYIGNRYVIRGEIDNYLIRPLNPLFQIIASTFQPEGLGELILGIAILIYTVPLMTFSWSWQIILALILCVILSSFVYTSIKLITASISFWTKRSIQIMSLTYEFSNFTRYPITIFSKPMQYLLKFIIPFAMTGYFITDAIVNQKSLVTPIVYLVIVVPTLVFVAYRLWLLGLSRYESAGS